ncbi:phosphoribosylaminoimidazole-succinocarboxamide synthase [Caldicellulosiruptor kronotskyensis 2002]|uniref:Phosphoribosylaminoimidazole-succinocarboxamide synthase n=1 Tax=Caldicellulosiruptor kronotskyensis (strain DSM 18902 / VKM B-2412 / 2002) TaxID=632348 RepID=E4SBJ6_CALK2|nr:phosphoribosylaminoimidazolesuccinocarboxamide synthase [Caldicellulosiruptor kronotskyensis]ADQ46119.1 phosphoribosylaminoimidazole-succinocarboxamide synthase [Caldicellulosiruptor kronotskyensis 2002]
MSYIITKLLYEGKAKKVYETDNPNVVVIEYKDDATAFDGTKRGIINNKGVVNNLVSNHFFKILESNNIPTHFIEQIDERKTAVKRVQIIPVEVIVRNIAAGSLSKRLGLEEGSILKRPILEFCYKNDELHDPQVNQYHILALELATEEEISKIEEYSFKVNDVLRNYLKQVNIDLIDFKLEFGRYRGDVILADEISPDTCRFWDTTTKEKLDKDRFRRDLGNVEEAYMEILRRLGLDKK